MRLSRALNAKITDITEGRVALSRYANRRDKNENELFTAARDLGWLITALDTPCDGIGLYKGVWHLIEIKGAAGPRGGLKGRLLTDAQQDFHKEVERRGGSILVWRTIEDVVESSDGAQNMVDWR